MGVYWEVTKTVFIIVTAIVAAIWDIRSRRIPNWLSYPAIFGGIILYSAVGQIEISLAGLFLGFILLVLPWVKGWLGEGDVKLAMGIGALGGPELLLKSLILGSAAGAIGGIILLIRAGELKRFGHNIFAAVVAWLTGSKMALENLGLYMPYGPFISIGVLMAFLWRGNLNDFWPF